MVLEKSAVGTLFVSSSTHRCLLGLRAPYKSHALCWSIFGGMVDNNETPKEALTRELKEEMEYSLIYEKIYPFDIYESAEHNFKYYTFLTIVSNEFTPKLNRENCGYCWINLGEWPQPMHKQARNSFCNKKAINRIRTILESHSHRII